MAKRKQRNVGIEDLFGIRLVGGVDVSPDGSRLVFSLSRTDLAKNRVFSSLYLVPTGGGRMRRLTRGDHADGMPRFSPDGSSVAFLSDRDKGRSLFVLPMDGGEPERITDRDGVVSDYAWAPDGKSFALAYRKLTDRERLERDEKKEELGRLPHFRHVTRLHYRVDGMGFRSPERTHVYVCRTTGGRMRCLTEGVDRDHAEPRFSPDGSRVSFTSNRVDDPDLFLENQDVYSVAPDGTDLRKVTREPGAAFAHVWSPDGSTIFYLGWEGGPGEGLDRLVHVRRVASGGGPSTDLTPDLDRATSNLVIGDTASTSFGGPGPAVSPDGSRVFFVVSTEGACHLASVPAEGGGIEWALVGDLVVFDFGWPAAGGPGWALIGDATNPADLHRLPEGAGGAAPKRLTKVNDAHLGKLRLVEPEEVRYRRKGGDVHGWVLKPPGFRKGVKYPAVLEVHGGPHVAYGHVFFHEMQLLAAAGYVVLMTNPRGSDGYGLEHREAIRGAWGTVDADDVTTALDGLLAEGFVDPERLYLTGGSYGGYMTNWLVGHTNRFRAAVTQRSVVSLAMLFSASDIGFVFRHEFGGAPWDEAERYRASSPLTFAEKIETPLLIVHSESDLRCPIADAEQLFTMLKILGREVEMVRFVGESHGLSRGGRPANRAERLRRILDWFRGHGGK